MGDRPTALLEAIASGADELTNGSGWPEGVEVLLRRIGEATGVSRVWLNRTVKLTETHILQEYLREWVRHPSLALIGQPGLAVFSRRRDTPVYGQMIADRLRGEAHRIRVCDLPDGQVRDALTAQQVKSMLTLPLQVEGTFWGTLGLDDCARERDWQEAEVALLRTAACLIANAIIRTRLDLKRTQFDLVLQATGAGYWDFDLGRRRLWGSPEFYRLLGYAPDAFRLNWRRLFRLIHADDRDPITRAVASCLEGQSDVLRADVRFVHRDGQPVWMEILGYVHRDDAGVPQRFAGIAIDIEQRKSEELTLRREARLDPLTGSLNRRAFMRLGGHLLGHAQEAGGSVSLLLLDLDHFKRINDRHGHAVGDAVLRRFAELCRRLLRRDDVFGRLGGEEFAALLPVADHEEAIGVAERIRAAVAAPDFCDDTGKVTVTVSIGIAPNIAEHDDIDGLLARADRALYAAKRGGRNRLAVA